MSKIHQSCSTSVLVVLVLFGTQLLLAQQSNTPTHFRHPKPARLLEPLECDGSSCTIQTELDDSQETYDITIRPNSDFTVEVFLDDQTEVMIDFIFGLFADANAVIEVFTMRSNKNSIAIAVDSDTDTMIPIIPKSKNFNANLLRIIITNPYSSEINVGLIVAEPDDDELAPWIIPVAVTGGILLVIVSTSMMYIWLRKRRERRQLQWIYTGSFYGGAQPNQIAAEESNAFNLEKDLDKMFPEAKNSKFKSSFPQKTCTICLEDFQGDQVCRQLHCQHVFHTECIKLWLGSQAEKKLKVFCPNCHKEIVKKTNKKPKA